jgi:hypothetical protein
MYDQTTERVLERCRIEFADKVASVHNRLSVGCRTAKASFPIAPYEVVYERRDIPWLIHEFRKAFEAKAAFAIGGPAWGQPLPLGEECYPLLKAKGPLHLVGLFAFSLQLLDYDYQTHPQFFDYAAGVMAHPAAPADVKGDPELMAEFPAKELPGLGGRMMWLGESLPPGERLAALGRIGVI